MTNVTPFPLTRALAAEANHRIGNSLALVAAMVRQQSASLSGGRRPATADDVLDVLHEAATRIEIVGQLHRRLAGGERSGLVDLGDYLRDIAETAVASLARAERTALTDASGEDCILSADQAMLVGLIVGELVTNAVKYSHPTGVAGKISVGCRRTVDAMLAVEVVDDGVGLPEGFDPMTQGHLGLRLVRTLATQLGAKLMFQSTGIGLCVRLLVPAAEPRHGVDPEYLHDAGRVHAFPPNCHG
jgi:two-component sensor histidine kinase